MTHTFLFARVYDMTTYNQATTTSQTAAAGTTPSTAVLTGMGMPYYYLYRWQL
jgi:membrane protease subunit (stomatin/prohibitin family)